MVAMAVTQPLWALRVPRGARVSVIAARGAFFCQSSWDSLVLLFVVRLKQQHEGKRPRRLKQRGQTSSSGAALGSRDLGVDYALILPGLSARTAPALQTSRHVRYSTADSPPPLRAAVITHAACADAWALDGARTRPE